MSRAPVVIDWLPPVVVALLLLLFAALAGHELTPVRVLAAFAGTLPLGARHRIPCPVLFVPFVAGIILEVVVVQPGAWVILLPVVMLFDLAQAGDRRQTLWMTGLTLPSIAISIIPFVDGTNAVIRALVQSVLLCTLAIVAGDGLRTRRLAAQHGIAEQRALAHEQAAEQRLRIAREIHDTVAHAMTAINVQAGVAAHLLDQDPALAHDALRAIKDSSGEALTELRGVLGVLREPGADAPLSPGAGLTDPTQLTDGLRAAGLTVTVDAAPLGDLDDAVRAAGYRILQEATTNVLRHAHATSVHIELRRHADVVTIAVSDDGVGASADATGNGTRGMRERALALGGELTAAGNSPCGWRVCARLPAVVSSS